MWRERICTQSLLIANLTQLLLQAMFGGLCAVVSKEKDLSSKLLNAGFCAGLFPRSLLMGSCWSGFYYRFKKKKKAFYTLSESFLISRQLPQSAFCREPIFFLLLYPSFPLVSSSFSPGSFTAFWTGRTCVLYPCLLYCLLANAVFLIAFVTVWKLLTEQRWDEQRFVFVIRTLTGWWDEMRTHM